VALAIHLHRYYRKTGRLEMIGKCGRGVVANLLLYHPEAASPAVALWLELEPEKKVRSVMADKHMDQSLLTKKD
jgi:hypothetical protein